MSDRYYSRPPDYSIQAAQMYLSGSQLQPNLYSKSLDLIEYFVKGSQDHIRTLGAESSHTVYVGYSGIALTHFMIHLKTRRQGSLEIAKQLTNMALRKLNGRRVSFLQGDAGPLAIAAAIDFTENNTRQAMEYVSRLVHLGEKSRDQEFEVLNGWSGYLYALMYVNSFINGAIPGSVLRKYVEMILREGFNNSRKSGSQVPLVYSWADTNYYGAAHGVAGILYMLLCSGVLSVSELESLIKPTLNDMIRRRFPSGNYRSSDDDTHDELVQWCHGAPGFVDLLILADNMIGRQYLALANDATDVVWERGLLQKGYSICHGVTGNAYSFLAMFRKTKSREQLYRAASYFQWTLTYPEHEGHKPDRPYSLFEGQAGVLYFLTEMADPETAAFPCYRLY